MKCTERCVFSEKSQFIIKRFKIIDFICKSNECFLKTVKVLKIVKWSFCQNIENACAFIELCVYYWLWIKNFAMIAASIYNLFKKNHIFSWEADEQEAMNHLKIVLSSQSIIQSLVYKNNMSDIVLTINSSLKE